MTIRSNGRVGLPRAWRALHIEDTDSGTIVYAERRTIWELCADACERAFRRWVWPWL
jgi:hypothetical protein